MKKILVVIGTYLPGYNAGGPVRSIKNLVDALGKEYEFRILTTDRDLGEKEPYRDVRTGEWTSVEGARVFYVAPGGFSKEAVLNAAREVSCIYVCGCFNDYARQVLRLNRRGKLKAKVVIASMGLFTPGAFAIKKTKKSVYMVLLRRFGWLNNIVWSATSDEEVLDIRRVAGQNAVCRIATDLPRKMTDDCRGISKKTAEIKIIFLSRISFEKNLSYAIDILEGVKGTVSFDIYGPVQDEGYWKECMNKIKKLPENVVCTYKGSVPSEEVEDVFSRYHIMLLPTRGENYGHVIAEAMAAGCVPVISDRTPWKELEKRKAGFVIGLEQPEQFTAAVQKLTDMGEEYQQYRLEAFRMAKELNRTEENLQMYRDLFDR